MSGERLEERTSGEPPAALQKHRFRLSPLWLVPLAAAGLVAYLAYHAVASHGPTVTLTFKTADGLSVEQTEVKHKAVTLGTVQGIELSEGEDHVIVHLRMEARAESMLTKNARFWVVRPRLQAGAIAALQTGLETLVSGSYIELDPGSGRGEKKLSFQGLEQPPGVRSGEPGTTFVLRADEIGPIGPGSSILHRQVPVGEVLDFDLDERNGSVSIRAFVRAPYDRLVVRDTCFWNVSGLDVGMGAGGLHVEVGSVRTLLSGGISFQTPIERTGGEHAEAGHSFPLYPSEDAAEIALNGQAIPYVAYFDDSIQGLAKGSAVKLFGMQVGNVTDLSLVLDPTDRARAHLVARVGLVLQPHRALSGPAAETLYPDAMRAQIASGLQVVLETSNYLTGEKALSLNYLPKQKAGPPREEDGALVLPSHSGGLDTLTDTLSEVAARLNSIPYEDIGKSLQHTMHSIDHAVSGPELQQALAGLSSTLEEVHALAHEARNGLAPAFQRLPAIAAHVDEAVANANAALTNLGGSNGEFQQKAQRALSQVADMARSIRLLSDFLERHPETLIRGRAPEAKP